MKALLDDNRLLLTTEAHRAGYSMPNEYFRLSEKAFLFWNKFCMALRPLDLTSAHLQSFLGNKMNSSVSDNDLLRPNMLHNRKMLSADGSKIMCSESIAPR